MSMRFVSMLVFACAVATAGGLRFASGPDLGGNIPAAPGVTAPPSPSLVVLTPGIILDASSEAVPQASLIVTNAVGGTVDATLSSRDGSFQLVTPSGDVCFLTVVGTSVVEVPFVPGAPITIVLP